MATTTEYGGGALASTCTALELTGCYQRAQVDAVGCWGAGGATVVTNGRLSASLRWLWRRRRWNELGCRCGEEGGRENANGARGAVRAVLVGLWHVLACPCRAGQGTGDAWPSLATTWRASPGDGRPLTPFASVDSES